MLLICNKVALPIGAKKFLNLITLLIPNMFNLYVNYMCVCGET